MPPLTVADIMDPDIPAVAPEDTLESVLRLMREHELSGTSPPKSLEHFEERLRKATAALARDLMTEDPDTIEAEAGVSDAASLISRSKHNRIPVVRHGRLVGLVTRVDVLEALTND